MGTFCSNCGSPLVESTAFCSKCGMATGSRATAGAAATPTVPAAKGSPALKIIIVLLCCLAVGGIVVVGAVAYIAHRVKAAVVQKAAENGVDLGAIGSSSSERTRALPKPCELLSKDEVSRLIGQPIERTEINDRACEYYGPAGLSAKLAEHEKSDILQRAKNPGGDPRANALTAMRILNGIGAANGNAEAGSSRGGELPLVVLRVSSDGKAIMNALNMTKAIFGAASKAAAGQQGEGADSGRDNSGADVFVGTSVSGLGDKAMWTAKSGLYVLQGDTLVDVNPSLFPDFHAKSVAVARAVLPKI